MFFAQLKLLTYISILDWFKVLIFNFFFRIRNVLFISSTKIHNCFLPSSPNVAVYSICTLYHTYLIKSIKIFYFIPGVQNFSTKLMTLNVFTCKFRSLCSVACKRDCNEEIKADCRAVWALNVSHSESRADKLLLVSESWGKQKNFKLEKNRWNLVQIHLGY